jgi:hypothetical protein
MDFGSTLAIALSGPAVVAVAKGIAIWLERYRGVELRVETTDGKIIAKNITSANVLEILRDANAIIGNKA